jgi:hypothetical protein
MTRHFPASRYKSPASRRFSPANLFSLSRYNRVDLLKRKNRLDRRVLRVTPLGSLQE